MVLCSFKFLARFIIEIAYPCAYLLISTKDTGVNLFHLFLKSCIPDFFIKGTIG